MTQEKIHREIRRSRDQRARKHRSKVKGYRTKSQATEQRRAEAIIARVDDNAAARYRRYLDDLDIEAREAYEEYDL